MNNMALGRYRPYQTSIHKLDARVKIIGMISVIVTIFLNYGSTPLNFIVYGFLFLGLFIVMLLGKVSIRGVLKAFKAMWLMAVFILIFNIFTPMNQTGGYFDINGFKLYYAALYNTAYIFVRLFLMIMTTSILTTTTAPMEITFGLEFLMTPLKWIKIPVTAFAMILALALRFIPTLMEDTQRLMKAQASRGVDFKEGKFKEKIKAITSLIIPLFSSSLMRSGDLAIAMECRGYDPKAKRTHYKVMHWSVADTIFLIAMMIVFAGSITLACFGMNYDLFQMFLELFK